MPYFNDRVYDNGLSVLDTEATAAYICSQEPTTYAQAITTYALGSKSGISIGAPQAHSPSGREVVLAAISDGACSATGTATHVAIVDVSNTRLLATQALNAQQAVTSGNPFSLTACKFYILAPT
jgi:hypothetical protein